MHNGYDKKGNQKPELRSCEANRFVLEYKFKNKVFVEERGKIVADAIALYIAHYKVKERIEDKTKGEITKGTSHSAQGVRGLVLLFGVGKIATDQEKHWDGEAKERKERMRVLKDVNANY